MATDDVPKSRADIEEAIATNKASLKNLEGNEGEFVRLIMWIRGSIESLEWVLTKWPKGRKTPSDPEPRELFEMDDKEKMVEVLEKMCGKPVGTEFLAFGDFDTKTIHKLLDAFDHWYAWKHKIGPYKPKMEERA